MKVLVVGSIGKQGENRREFLVNELTYAGFEVLVAGHSYEEKDWRDHYEEAQKIIQESEDFFYENDFDAVVADLSAASDGRSHQLSMARDSLIPTFGFAPVTVASPFWLQVERFFTEMEPLVNTLRSLEIKLELKRNEEEKRKNKEDNNPFYRLWGRAWTSFVWLTVGSLLLIILGLVFFRSDGLGIAITGFFLLLFIVFITYLRHRTIQKVRNNKQTAD